MSKVLKKGDDFLVMGDIDLDKIIRIQNKIDKIKFKQNKKLKSFLNGKLREFYKKHTTESLNKLMIIECPKSPLHLLIVNRGYKNAQAHLLREKIMKDDKKGVEKLNKKISGFNREMSAFAIHMKGKIADLHTLISKGVGFPVEMLSKYYQHDKDLFPVLELSAKDDPAASEQRLNLQRAYQNKNHKLMMKVKKEMFDFNKSLGHVSHVCVGCGCHYFEGKFEHLDLCKYGVFCVCSMTEMFPESTTIDKKEATKDFNEFVKRLK